MAGLNLQKSERLQKLLEDICNDGSLPEDIQSKAKDMMDRPTISWIHLKGVLEAVRERWGQTRKLWLHEECSGCKPVLVSPAPRAKSPELLKRLVALQKLQDQKQYDAMVKDITQAEEEAKAKSEGGLVTYKAQLSIGLHVLVMMGTFFAACYAGMSYISSNSVHHLVGGLCGLIFAMLMETVLLIIRTTVPPRLPVEEALKRPRQQQEQQPPLPPRESQARDGAAREEHRQPDIAGKKEV